MLSGNKADLVWTTAKKKGALCSAYSVFVCDVRVGVTLPSFIVQVWPNICKQWNYYEPERRAPTMSAAAVYMPSEVFKKK